MEARDEDDDAKLRAADESTISSLRSMLPQNNHEFLETFMAAAGNTLEWYDFAVFGFFGDVIGEVFFPPQAGHSQTVESFAVFGLAFTMRPIGGVLMGWIGDRYGRKKALIISIFMMAFPTFAMGCLPSYERVGPLAIVLLILIRMLQGVSVGGQLMSSLVFTLESRDQSVWGLYGSLVVAAANCGTLLGNLIAFALQSSLTDDQIKSWGWRVPFLSGIVVSLSGFYLRSSKSEDHSGQRPLDHAQSSLSETTSSEQEEESEDAFHDEPGDKKGDEWLVVGNGSNGHGGPPLNNHASQQSPPSPSNPIRLAFARENLRPLLAATMVPTLWAAGFYLSFVWMATYMKELAANTIDKSFAVNAFSLLLSVCIFFPVAGGLSDKWGRVRTMTMGGLAMGILSPLLIWVIGLGNAFAAFGAQCIMGVALSFFGAPMYAWLVEGFDPEARLTSVAIGYNIAQAVAGGSSPALATLLVDNVSVNAPGWMLTVLAVVALTGLRCVAPARNKVSSAATSQRFAPIQSQESNLHDSNDLELTENDREIS